MVWTFRSHGSSEGRLMLKRHGICCSIADVELIPKNAFIKCIFSCQTECHFACGLILPCFKYQVDILSSPREYLPKEEPYPLQKNDAKYHTRPSQLTLRQILESTFHSRSNSCTLTPETAHNRSLIGGARPLGHGRDVLLPFQLITLRIAGPRFALQPEVFLTYLPKKFFVLPRVAKK